MAQAYHRLEHTVFLAHWTSGWDKSGRILSEHSAKNGGFPAGRLAEAMNRSGTVLTKHFRSMRRGLAALPGGLHPDSRDEAMHCCVAVAGIIKITAPLRVMDRSMPMVRKCLPAVLGHVVPPSAGLNPTLLAEAMWGGGAGWGSAEPGRRGRRSQITTSSVVLMFPLGH